MIRFVATILLLALASGCSNDQGVLARVEGDAISVDDFLYAARGLEARYPGSPDSAKWTLLDDLVNRRLMILEARELSRANQDPMREWWWYLNSWTASRTAPV